MSRPDQAPVSLEAPTGFRIATYAALSYGSSVFGRRGFFVFPTLYAALLVFYDARPDIGQRIFPKLWREAN